ncbi:MAG TPA: hypothetical protein VHY91_04345 [Pirellulales bacterium]|nr:hypothetical protein [Pirellulales bacterium]
MIEKQFVSSDRDRVKVSFVEDAMPESASPPAPRVAVRLIPSKRVIQADTVADRHDQKKVSSAEISPRLRLKSGADPKPFQTTDSTLKIMTAARVDSQPRPEKPE